MWFVFIAFINLKNEKGFECGRCVGVNFAFGAAKGWKCYNWKYETNLSYKSRYVSKEKKALVRLTFVILFYNSSVNLWLGYFQLWGTEWTRIRRTVIMKGKFKR